MNEQHWLTTDYPQIIFENNSVGLMKKEIWDASDDRIDAILADGAEKARQVASRTLGRLRRAVGVA